jgi:hypothetical protein
MASDNGFELDECCKKGIHPRSANLRGYQACFFFCGPSELFAIATFHPPKSRENREPEVRGFIDLKSNLACEGDKIGEAVAAMVHEMFIINIVESRTGRNLDMGDAPRPEDTVNLCQSSFVGVDVLQHVKAAYAVHTGAGERALPEIEL